MTIYRNPKCRARVAVVVAMALALSVLAVAPAGAAAQPCGDVTLTDADGGAALDAAVEAADSCPGAQTIFLEPGNYLLVRTLIVDDELSVIGTDPSDRSVIQVELNSNVGGSLDAFHVAATTANFVLQNIEVQGTDRVGIGDFRAPTTIDNVLYSGGSATCGIATPRGVSAIGVQMEVTNSLFVDSNCVAVSGIEGAVVSIVGTDITGTVGSGASSIDGSMTISGSTIHGNTGQGVLASASSITINDTAIYENGTHGIENNGKTVVKDSLIGVRSEGGQLIAAGNGDYGIETYFGELEVTGGTIAYNNAGIRVAVGPATIVDATIRDNTTTGLLAITSTLAVSLTGTTLTNNAPDCEFQFDATLDDMGGNVDSDGTCLLADVFCNGQLVTINMNAGASGVGTAGDDVILGTAGDDSIDAGAGNDTVCAGDGNDTAVGGDGDDLLFGEGGRDILRGNPGKDELDGGDGNDRVLGGIGDDTIRGGNGDDYLGGFGGHDTIDGGPGNDIVFGGFGADIIDGGDGEDTVRGLIGNDTINGGPGNDVLSGDRGRDTINGGPGNDVIAGGNADDVVSGNGGDDTVSGGKADDILSGGGGIDTCSGNLQNVIDTADATCETIFGVP